MKKSTLKKIAEKEESASTTPERAALAQMSLEQLFLQLDNEVQPPAEETAQGDTEFDKIQKEVSELPKIECELEAKSDVKAEQSKPKQLVVNVNDPIVVPQKRKEKPTDAGAKWFHMKTPEMTDALKRDLLVLKNRSVLDPKRHYKKEKWEIPKYFETGVIIEGNTEFYSARMTRKARGKTLADEILRDSEANAYFKRKYAEIQSKNINGNKSYYKKLKSKRHGH